MLSHVQLYTVHGILQARIVGSLSLLQGIFPNQGSNSGLLLCEQILYQLSYREAPYRYTYKFKDTIQIYNIVVH